MNSGCTSSGMPPFPPLPQRQAVSFPRISTIGAMEQILGGLGPGLADGMASCSCSRRYKGERRCPCTVPRQRPDLLKLHFTLLGTVRSSWVLRIKEMSQLFCHVLVLIFMPFLLPGASRMGIPSFFPPTKHHAPACRLASHVKTLWQYIGHPLEMGTSLLDRPA